MIKCEKGVWLNVQFKPFQSTAYAPRYRYNLEKKHICAYCKKPIEDREYIIYIGYPPITYHADCVREMANTTEEGIEHD